MFIKSFLGTSLVVQWLRCYPSTTGGMGSIPGLGTKSQKKVKEFFFLPSFLSFSKQIGVKPRKHEAGPTSSNTVKQRFDSEGLLPPFLSSLLCFVSLLTSRVPCLHAESSSPKQPFPSAYHFSHFAFLQNHYPKFIKMILSLSLVNKSA